MMTIRDEIYRMKPERAERLRKDLAEQLEFEKHKLAQMRSRKKRVIKKLDADIHKVEENVNNLMNTIHVIDRTHFNTLDPGELTEAEFDEII